MSRRRPVARLVLARRAAVLCASLTLSQVAGCYTRQPLSGPGSPGAVLVVSLNDRGRADLAQSVGPNVDRLEGRVLSSTDSSVALSMRSSRTFSGDETRWTGERVEVRRSGARAFEQRALARGRTYTLVGIAVAGLAALILTRTLDIGGQPDRDPPVVPPVGS